MQGRSFKISEENFVKLIPSWLYVKVNESLKVAFFFLGSKLHIYAPLQNVKSLLLWSTPNTPHTQNNINDCLKSSQLI